MERLAHIPHDRELDREIFESKYHRTSAWEDTVIDFVPRPELAKLQLQDDRRRTLRARRPAGQEWEFNAELDRETDESLAILGGGPFAFLIDDDLRDYIAWGKAKSPRTRSALASKLRALADVSTIGLE